MENTMIGKSLFTGRQVELTELDPEKDAQAISIWTKQPAFNRKFFNSTFKPRPMSEVKKKLQEMLKEADENRQAIYFAIRKINSPELIGMLWFPWVDAQHQTSSMYLSFGSGKIWLLWGRRRSIWRLIMHSWSSACTAWR